MSALSPLDEAVALSRAVLAAAEATLTGAGLALPSRRYVSVQGGDWLPTEDSGCDQLVVVPFVLLQRYNSPITAAGAGGDPGGQSIVRIVDFQIIHSACVEQDVRARRLAPGDIALGYDDLQNAGTHWAETVPIIAARWAFGREFAGNIALSLCDYGIMHRQSFVTLVEPWVEGGCAGSSVTLQVQL